jgi:hypothetical protein
MWFLYRCSAGNTYLRAVLMILGAATAAIFWSARPQMFTFLFSTILLWIVFRYKREQVDRLWWIVPLMWIWGQLHAGWSIGYLLLFAFLVGECLNLVTQSQQSLIGWRGWRKLLLVTLISVPLLSISPYGFNNLLVPIQTVSIDSLRSFIQEWNPPAFQGRETWPLIATIVLLFAVLWASRLSFDWSAFFLLGGTLFLALLYARNIALFAVVSVPILSYHCQQILADRGWILRTRATVPVRIGIINLVLAALVVGGVLLYAVGLLLPERVLQAQEQVLPVHAVAYLQEHALPREMFNSYNWGGYLMLHLPQYPVFIDGRTDIYGDFLFTYYEAMMAGDNWQQILDRYGIRFVLIEAASPLALTLQQDTAWQEAYRDDVAVIYVKNS